MLVRSFLLLVCAVSCSTFLTAASRPAFSRSVGTRSIFGVGRGGGLFGKNNEDAKTEQSEVSSSNDGDKTVYPAMSQAEIEDWMEHIPVFAVTDSNGAGVVLKPENDTSVFYFFLNPLQANATLNQLTEANEEMDLRVSAFSLGKVWFTMIKGEASLPDAKDIEYRLVPDTRDLLGARMLLTMTPEDGEKMKANGGMTPEMAEEAIQRAMTDSPKFKETFNEIPVFTIAQMRMQKQSTDDDDASGEPETLLPMYFSMQSMIGTWQEFMKQAPADVQGVEPAINLMSLHDLIGMMQKESEIDWRNVVLVPSAMPGMQETQGATTSAAADPMSQMGGATLGDD